MDPSEEAVKDDDNIDDNNKDIKFNPSLGALDDEVNVQENLEEEKKKKNYGDDCEEQERTKDGKNDDGGGCGQNNNKSNDECGDDDYDEVIVIVIRPPIRKWVFLFLLLFGLVFLGSFLYVVLYPYDRHALGWGSWFALAVSSVALSICLFLLCKDIRKKLILSFKRDGRGGSITARDSGFCTPLKQISWNNNEIPITVTKCEGRRTGTVLHYEVYVKELSFLSRMEYKKGNELLELKRRYYPNMFHVKTRRVFESNPTEHAAPACYY